MSRRRCGSYSDLPDRVKQPRQSVPSTRCSYDIALKLGELTTQFLRESARMVEEVVWKWMRYLLQDESRGANRDRHSGMHRESAVPLSKSTIGDSSEQAVYWKDYKAKPALHTSNFPCS